MEMATGYAAMPKVYNATLNRGTRAHMLSLKTKVTNLISKTIRGTTCYD